ncbi:MAG TPA: Rnf-Nqr domain containing protein [Limnochordia bacterium]|nr:Rnf-Nqr domain containing protein [Limnochordia bacterium]
MKAFWEGLWTKNPVLVLALGLVPAVAATTTAANGLALGLITAVILVIAAFINWLLVPHVPDNARTAVKLLVLIVLVVAAYSVLLGQNPAMVSSLGIFLPLIAFSDLLLHQGEGTDGLTQVVLGACGRGLGFTAVLLVLGIIREFLGSGSIFGQQIVEGALPPLALAASVPGGMVVLGLLMAFVNLVSKRGGELHD